MTTVQQITEAAYARPTANVSWKLAIPTVDGGTPDSPTLVVQVEG